MITQGCDKVPELVNDANMRLGLDTNSFVVVVVSVVVIVVVIVIVVVVVVVVFFYNIYNRLHNT